MEGLLVVVASKKERVVAAIAPVSYLLGGYIFTPLVILAPLGVYLYARKFSLEFPRLHALRLIDFIVTLVIYTLLFGALYLGVEIVEQDSGDDSILIMGNDLALAVYWAAAVLYVLIATLLAVYKALSGMAYQYPLSLRLFETLGGRKGRDKPNGQQQGAQSSQEA